MNDKNRFLPENRFVGDIEDGKRYPYGVYTKKESDERYAAKAVESYVAQLAEDVSTKANESECVDIRARLDALEYKGITILSFNASPTVCEMGSSNTLNLTWTLNKDATAQNINGTAVSGNSKQYENVSSNTSYTLNVTDDNSAATKTINIEFANDIYYGAAPDLSTVTSLSSILSNDKTRTITVTAAANEYIIYAIPARLGDVVFFVGGFEGGFENPDEQLLANGSGYEELYRVYRSTNKNLGTTIVDVREGY